MPLSQSLDFANITNKPTTLAGYGVAAGDALFASVTAGAANAVAYANVSGKPTTLAGLGIAAGDGLFASVAVSFANLTGKPTTVAGYGITDAVKTDIGSGAVGSIMVGRPSVTTVDGATIAGANLTLVTTAYTAGTLAAAATGLGTWRNISGTSLSAVIAGVWQRIA